MKHIHPGISLLLFFLLFPMCASNAQIRQEEGIQFLHLKFKKEGIELLESTVTDGTLKKPRRTDQKYGIHYEVRNENNTVVWEDVLENPFTQRVEYVDDDGNLRSMTVEREEAEVFIRIPFYPDARSVHFYVLEDQATELRKERPERRYLGTIELR